MTLHNSNICINFSLGKVKLSNFISYFLIKITFFNHWYLASLGVLIFLESENLKYSSLRKKFKESDGAFPKENKLISSILLLDELGGKIGFKRRYKWQYKDREVFIVIAYKTYSIYYDSEVLYKKTFSKTVVFKSGPWVNEFNEYVKSLNTEKKIPLAKDLTKEQKIYEEISF
jgi:hypothetical protein